MYKRQMLPFEARAIRMKRTAHTRTRSASFTPSLTPSRCRRWAIPALTGISISSSLPLRAFGGSKEMCIRDRYYTKQIRNEAELVLIDVRQYCKVSFFDKSDISMRDDVV